MTVHINKDKHGGFAHTIPQSIDSYDGDIISPVKLERYWEGSTIFLTQRDGEGPSAHCMILTEEQARELKMVLGVLFP